ncbi:DUF503 family protein [Candidatus Bipolaricaulota bacterium]|jgi:uncharacterized protein YlxP (DUF503 family)|nr:DUF503 family protein [Candidatus Bipolaricaulota bacterium]TFH10803.1 MAG: DUF503 family protein [Candidatus Atribacteria bacterium]
MKAAVLTIRFRLYAMESIKQKRSIVKRILADVQRQGPSFAACESGDQDDLQHMMIRVAHLSNDPRFSDSALRKLQAKLERGEGYEIEEADLEIL